MTPEGPRPIAGFETEPASRSASPVASQRIAEVLAERILAGTLAPGTRIKQDEIAAELRASRIPVREALRILESRGLVTLRANSGAWVHSMEQHDLQMSYQIRERIEPLLLRDSLPRLADTHVARMRELQEQIEAEGSDVDTFLVLDREFHWTAYAAHGSPNLAAMIARLWDTTQAYRRAFTRLAGDDRAWIINSEHRLLLDAVASRDVQSACAVLELHIRRTRTELGRHPEVFSAPATPS